MTVNLEIPYVRFIGNGTTKEFAFVWSCQDVIENIVTVDGLPQEANLDFKYTNFTHEFGGTVRFKKPPLNGTDILIYRETPVTQQIDYEEYTAFPAETHEGQMDKDTRILQEIIHAGRGVGGPVDLGVVLGPDYVDVTNSRGTDARIPSWDCMAPFAGVFHGEVTTSAPADGDPTDKPDAYIWWEIAP